MYKQGSCNDCKYFEPFTDGTNKNFCTKPSKPKLVRCDEWCPGFEYKTKFITVDIIRVKDIERFKSTYPAFTDSNVIVSTSIKSIAAVLGVQVSESNRNKFQEKVETIRTSEVKKGEQDSSGRFKLDTIVVEIKKSWAY